MVFDFNMYTKAMSYRHMWAILVFVVAISFAVYSCKTNNSEKRRRERAKKALSTLPYASFVQDGRSIEGVVRYKKNLVQPGLNLFTPAAFPEIHLMKSSGEIVHSWMIADSRYASINWHHVEFMPGGDGLIALSFEKGIMRIGWNSEVRWFREMRVHHEANVTSRGDIYTIRNHVVKINHKGKKLPIVSDAIVVLGEDGKIKRDFPLHVLFGERIPERRLMQIQKMVERGGYQDYLSKPSKYQVTPFDVFHTNSAQFLEAGLSGIAGPGTVLICVRQLNVIAIIDINKGKIVWELKGVDLQEPHHPRLLQNGNILIFDNGVYRRYSRVIEIAPVSGKIVWQYVGRPKRSFFTLKRGSNQRLKNGNTLIVESDNGRAFEVTRDGQIVWEYLGPKMTPTKRSIVYRMERLSAEFSKELLEASLKQ